jgi:transcriptional regulator with XRE-family HTH domain
MNAEARAILEGEHTRAPSEIPVRKPRERSSLRSTIDHQRSEFLRGCRARLEPEDVGLPKDARARGGGLRRQDVAELAGVSASWYTWLEQGRDIRVSDEVLDRVSQALRLSEDERVYLFSLVQRRPPPLQHLLTQCPPDVERMLHTLPVPAVVLNLRCDVLAWNAVNSLLYRDYGLLPPEERNLLEILMIKPVHTLTPAQQEAMARRLMGRLRYDA